MQVYNCFFCTKSACGVFFLFSFACFPSATIMISLLSFRLVTCHAHTSKAMHLTLLPPPLCRACLGRFLQALSHIFSTAFPCFLFFCTTLFRLKESLQTRSSSPSLQILERGVRLRTINMSFHSSKCLSSELLASPDHEFS